MKWSKAVLQEDKSGAGVKDEHQVQVKNQTSYGAAGGVSIGDTLEMEGKKCQRGCKERIARICRLDIKEWE